MSNLVSYKPVIFLAFANDREENVGYLRNLPEEARKLREVFEAEPISDLCEVVVRSNCTAEDIFKVFQDPKYRNRIAVFHFGGHANGYELLLESAAGGSVAADSASFAAFLSEQIGLQLVFLNGCSTQQQTQDLLLANIPLVIATSRAINDATATQFACRFYQQVANGLSFRSAWRESEATIQTELGGQTRGAYFANVAGEQTERDNLIADRWPWDLYVHEGSQVAETWNLPSAANDPLFGLPPLPQQDLPKIPFRHLNWFTRRDAEVFFGRGHQIRELYDRMTAPRTAPIVLFYGQSGVGKSSLLDAGLLPRLQHDNEVKYLRRDHNIGLAGTLRSPFFSADDNSTLDAHVWNSREQKVGRPLTIILDQVEELFTRPCGSKSDAQELNEFLELVHSIFADSTSRPKGKLVLAFRKEWLAEIEARLVEHQLPRTRVFLEPLDQAGIIEVIRGPASNKRLIDQYGLQVEESLPQLIADDLLEDRDSAIAPTLQILLTKMWNKSTVENYEKPVFSQELYQKLKRDGILMRDFLNQQITTFRKKHPEVVDSGLLLDVVSLHTTPLGTADVCDVAELKKKYNHVEDKLPQLLEQCQNLHLLTVGSDSNGSTRKTTRLAHDTLAPLVRERYDDSDKPGQRARRILDNRSVDWENNGSGTPLDAADLDVVEEGIWGTRSLSSTEKRLLDASRKLRSQLQRNRKILKIAGLVAVVAITATAIFAFWESANAEKARENAVIAKNDAVAAKDSALESKVAADAALELAKREAYNQQLQRIYTIIGDEPDTSLSLLHDMNVCPDRFKDFTWHYANFLCNQQKLVISNPETQFQSVKFSPDEKTIVSGDVDGAVQLWDVETGKCLKVYTPDPETDPSWVGDVQFDPLNGEIIVAAYGNGYACVWETKTGKLLRTIGSANLYNGKLTFSNNGRRIALGRWDNKIDIIKNQKRIIRNQEKQLEVEITLDADHEISCLDFDPTNQNEVRAGGPLGRFTVWNTNEKSVERMEPRNNFNTTAIASADRNGSVDTVVAGADGVIRFYGERFGDLRVSEGSINAMTLGSKNEILAVAGDKSTIRLVDTLTKTWKTLPGGESAVTALDWGNKNGLLAAAGRDGTIRIWLPQTDINGSTPRDFMLSIAISNDKKMIALGNGSGEIKIADPDSGRHIKSLIGHRGPVFSLTFTDQGQLVSAGADKTIRVWELSDLDNSKSKHWMLGEHQSEVFDVRLIPGKNLVASATRHGMVCVWDLDSRECVKTNQVNQSSNETRALAVSKDGEWIAFGIGPSINLWKWQTDLSVKSLSGHSQQIMDLSFSPNGTLASASADNTTRIWNLVDKSFIETSHTHVVSTIRFSNDGKTLITGDWGGWTRIWDPQTGRLRSELARGGGSCYSIAFSKDDRMIAEAGSNYFKIRHAKKIEKKVVAYQPEKLTFNPKLTEPVISKTQWEAMTGFDLNRLEENRTFKNTIDMELVAVPAGEFRMGSATSPEQTAGEFFTRPQLFLDEHPQHTVKITRPILVGKYEVTVGQFKKFVESTGYITEAERDNNWRGSLDPNSGTEVNFRPEGKWTKPEADEIRDDLPVVFVSWNDAVAFCRWLSKETGQRYRLPTEAEWEYVCRAGTTTKFSSGESARTLKKYANLPDSVNFGYGLKSTVDWDDGFKNLAPVGSFLPNPFQLHDMHGNVWEWCQDSYDPAAYQSVSGTRIDPLIDEDSPEFRVMRGGCYR